MNTLEQSLNNREHALVNMYRTITNGLRNALEASTEENKQLKIQVAEQELEIMRLRKELRS